MRKTIKTRREESANYCSVFFNGKTIRIPIDPSKPITELMYPEFYDVAINSRCMANCKYCYTSARKNGKNFPDVVNHIIKIFGNMTPEQRPFQIAIGASGEPTLHPDFDKILKAFYDLGIVPNYTTNGMYFDDKLIDLTKKYCGGIACTIHNHLEKYWRKTIELSIEHKIKINVHFIISDEQSIDDLRKLYTEYNGKIDYFVLLPYMNVGFASKYPKIIAYDVLEAWIDTIHSFSNIAFGANFYNFLKPLRKWNVSIYPPEILSKYLVLDNPPKLFCSSFNTTTELYRNWLPKHGT